MTWEMLGPEHADCGVCSLKDSCASRRFVTSSIGKNYQHGGLMVVGEFPATLDIQYGIPFSGRAGQLLDALLEDAGIPVDAVWKTNVLLGRPPHVDPKHLKDHVDDIYACLPRLEKEIEQARPRVILALGAFGLDAFTGAAITKNKQFPNDCDVCDPALRKVGPVIQCFNGACRHTIHAPLGDEDAQGVWRFEFLQKYPDCTQCNTSWKRAKLKMIACTSCGGKKRRMEQVTEFKKTKVLTGRNGLVGAVLHAHELPGGLDELGVAYVIPTYSPAMLLMRPNKNQKSKYLAGGQFAARACVDHLKKAARLLHADAKFDVELLSTEGLACESAAVMVDEYTAEPGDFDVDIETNTKDGAWAVTNIVCLGIKRKGSIRALVIDTREIGSDWNVGNPLMEAIVRFFDSDAHKKILHNGPYDYVVMSRLWGIDVVGYERDTMIEHNACYPDEEHGLGFCAHELTDAPAWKGGSVAEHEWNDHAALSGYRTFEDLALYNARDLMATDLVDQALTGGTGKAGRIAVEKTAEVLRVDMEMAHIGIAMEIGGLPLHRPALQKIDDEQSVELAGHLTKMRDILGDDKFTPSGDKLLHVLFHPEGMLKLPVLSTTKTGRPSADADTLRLHVKEPFVKALLDFRKIEYNLSHFVRSSDLARLGDDGRLHPAWNITGARTGRWTSSPNVQNWPKWMRAAFVAKHGRRIVGADQAQLEMRIIANLSGDENLIHRCSTADENDKLNPECDPHSYVAALVFGAAFTGLDRNDPLHYKAKAGEKKCKCQKCRRNALRDINKRTIYGLNYGAGEATVLEAIYNGGYDGPPIDIDFIKRVVQIYFRAFPGVPRWRDATWKRAVDEREIRSPLYGRHRIFPLGDVEPSIIYNFPIQSGGADVMAKGLMVLRRTLPKIDPTAVFIAQIHDAIYVECDERREDDVAHAVEDALTFSLAFTPGGLAMPYVASASTGQHLAEF